MIQVISPDAFCRLVYFFSVLLTLVLLAPLSVGAQERSSENPQRSGDLLTSLRGPLQQRLAAAYPDSFREGVEIFWEQRDGWISEEVYLWWLSRLEEDDVHGVRQDCADRMFSRISEQGPVFSATRKRRICAVVGASRNLLDSKYGSLIDAHDLVFRVNQAPTGDYELDVGSKTTHHVLWPRALKERDFDRRAFHLMTPISNQTAGVLDRIVELTEEDFRWEPELVRIIHPEFVKYLHESWTKERMHYPSTGFIALMMALHVCDEVDVFGFGADASGRWDRYYEDHPASVSDFHPSDFEARLRREMDEKGILNAFYGSRPDQGSRMEAATRD